MDECLNDDDDEEHHRVFSDYFGAQHEQRSVHAGSANLRRNALHPEPACRTVRLKPVRIRNHLIPALAGTYGRSTGR